MSDDENRQFIPGIDITVARARAYAEMMNVPEVEPVRRSQRSDKPTKTSQTSHVSCTHEATKSARAKCRRERNAK